MRVFGCQLDIAWENKAANFARVDELLEDAAPPPGSLIVLPEMFATGFSMDVEGIAEADGGETSRFLADLAKRRQSFVIGGLVVRAQDDRGANEAAVFGPDGVEIARYRKLHPFTYGGESEHYAAGERIVCADCGPFPTAPFICYDLRFPEAFRQAARCGAELMVVIACWPAPRHAHWLALLSVRAIENQAYVVGVNRCGEDPKLSYAGGSRIIGPTGEILADGGGAEGVIRAAIDRGALREYRDSFPTLDDIHPELLGPVV